jgi:hypothetical protein
VIVVWVAACVALTVISLYLLISRDRSLAREEALWVEIERLRYVNLYCGLGPVKDEAGE